MKEILEIIGHSRERASDPLCRKTASPKNPLTLLHAPAAKVAGIEPRRKRQVVYP